MSSFTGASEEKISGIDDDMLKIENFIIDCEGTEILGNYILMDSSCFVWIGHRDQAFSILDMALLTKYDNLPLTSTIFNDSDSSSFGVGIAQRISKKFAIQCFLSYNIVSPDTKFQYLVEKKLIEIFSNHFSVVADKNRLKC